MGITRMPTLTSTTCMFLVCLTIIVMMRMQSHLVGMSVWVCIHDHLGGVSGLTPSRADGSLLFGCCFRSCDTCMNYARTWQGPFIEDFSPMLRALPLNLPVAACSEYDVGVTTTSILPSADYGLSCRMSAYLLLLLVVGQLETLIELKSCNSSDNI